MINTKCELVLQDLYFYDFKSAYPRILSSIGWNFDNVDLDNKEERNIAIGLAQRDNKNLSSYLIDTVTQLLNYYLEENGVDNSEIIVSQRDGFILKKRLEFIDGLMKLDYRGHIDTIIITPDRKKYMTCQDNKVEVKGISNQYPALDTIYNKFSKLTFYNKKSLFRHMEKIKSEILTSEDKNLYMIELEKGRYAIYTKRGPIEIKDEQYFKVESIDRKKYFDHYFREFFQSIILEFFNES